MDCLVGGFAQIENIRATFRREVHALAYQSAETEQGDTEPVFLVLAILLEHALRDQSGGQPVDRALGNSETLGKTGDTDLGFAFGKGFQEANSSRYRRETARRLPVAGRSGLLHSFVLRVGINLCGHQALPVESAHAAAPASSAAISVAGLPWVMRVTPECPGTLPWSDMGESSSEPGVP